MARAETCSGTESDTSTGPGRSGLRGRQWVRSAAVAVSYIVVSALFVGIYLRATEIWTQSQLVSYVWGTGSYPGHHLIFECRVLVPLVARLGSHLLPLDVSRIFIGIAFLSVLGALEAYRRYLTCFVRPRFAALLALTLVYPMLWNFCLLNRIYFPFDLPAVLLFILGLYFLHARRWALYYVVLVLGQLNHEGAVLLLVVFWFASRDSMAFSARVRHLLLQLAALVVVKFGVCLVGGFGVEELGGVFRPGTYIPVNMAVVRDMLTLRGSALKDWAKLVLAFGGLWLLLPFVKRRVPRFLTAATMSGVVYIVLVACTAIIDEVRGYGPLVPIVLTPAVYVVAKALGGTKFEE